MKVLRRMLKRFEGEMAAVAFAEAGEFETAREILKSSVSEEVSNGNSVFDSEESQGLNILKHAESK
ncbi:hypothetical protein MNBD_NITROSPIRAE03-842 [hydrothermal vent metagenome]|uniref:Uncharacterized protein n=1 Tax=hydrothermal vent metagenome TaxID=652676 RepID=A0A3B1DF70_9ZZZZ|nr:MAG: hypothetical protein IEMM0007_0033 [bacterium]